jgi:hypothetical protein
MTELNKIVTFRMPVTEYEDLGYLVDAIKQISAENVIRNPLFKSLLDDIQSTKERKGVTVSMADLIRLGCRLVLAEHKDQIALVRTSKERLLQELKKRN